MIELIRDGKEKDVLIYTDERDTAKKLRAALNQAGAIYSGKESGFSWRVPRDEAKRAFRELGIKKQHFESVQI